MKKLLLLLGTITSVNVFAITTEVTIINNTNSSLPIEVIDSDHFDCKTSKDKDWINCGKNNNLNIDRVPANGQYTFQIAQDGKQSSSLYVRLGANMNGKIGDNNGVYAYDFGMWTSNSQTLTAYNTDNYNGNLKYNPSIWNYYDSSKYPTDPGTYFSMVMGANHQEIITNITSDELAGTGGLLKATVTIGQAPIAMTGIKPW